MNEKENVNVNVNRDPQLEEIGKETLEDIRFRAQSLRQMLKNMKRHVDKAINQMENGQPPDGLRDFGPIGHQAPFDVAKKVVQLQETLNLSRTLMWAGVLTPDQVEEAYAKGVTSASNSSPVKQGDR